MIGQPHDEVLLALEVAARRRHKATLARTEHQKHKLDVNGYHRMQREMNETTFLAPIDADTTRANIYYIKKKFIKFCREKDHGTWRNAIAWQYCDKGLIMTFLFWICETYLQHRRKLSKRKTVNQYWRDLKMLYRRSNEGRVINANDCEEIRKYINGDLTVKFKLDDQPGTKPVLGVDDLLLGLTHHWCRDKSIFPTEDDRLDLSTLMLFQSYTACRPAELVDGTKTRGGKDPMLDESDPEDFSTSRALNQSPTSHTTPSIDERQVLTDLTEGTARIPRGTVSEPRGSIFEGHSTIDRCAPRHSVPTSVITGSVTCSKTDTNDAEDDAHLIRKHKALCYEDIVLWIVQDPNGGGRDVLAMEVFFRYHKGVDRKPKPTVFLFRENPLPILCPVTHFLARAIRDDAIEVDGFMQAAPFFSTQIRRSATKVHWKPSKLKTPVFRKSVRTAGGWFKSDTEPMKYSTYAFYLDRIGSELGSEEKWTSYCFRRGHANALLGIAPDSIVDQVMRHDPMTGCMQNAYQNCRIGFNTQDAFLERDPSADGLTRAFTHMSIRCNPEVPKEIPKTDLARLPLDPEVADLQRRVKLMSIRIRQEHGYIKYAPKEIKEVYQLLQRSLRNAEKAFRHDMTKVYQEACRRRIHNEELQRQRSRAATNSIDRNSIPNPDMQHQLEEREQLQAILSDFRQAIPTKDITNRKIQAVDLMVRLASRCEARPPSSLAPAETRICQKLPYTKKSSDGVEVEEFPFILGKTQCIYCVGEERLPYSIRAHSFNRVSHMMDHVENVHLKHERTGGRFVCRHPRCKQLGDFLPSLDCFKKHVQSVHGVNLRR